MARITLLILEAYAGLRRFLTELGELSLFAGRFFGETFRRPFEFRELLRQCYQMGNRSLVLVGCFKVYYSKKGTAGVGFAANTAVVFTSMLLFIIGFITVFVSDIFYEL